MSITITGGFTATGGGWTLEAPPAGVKAIFGYGYSHSLATSVSMTNLVTNTGVVGNDVTGVGTARSVPGAASYGS